MHVVVNDGPLLRRRAEWKALQHQKWVFGGWKGAGAKKKKSVARDDDEEKILMKAI